MAEIRTMNEVRILFVTVGEFRAYMARVLRYVDRGDVAEIQITRSGKALYVIKSLQVTVQSVPADGPITF